MQVCTVMGPAGPANHRIFQDGLLSLPVYCALQVRALLEQPAIAEVVQYRKRKDHFMFTIESSGVIQPDLLLTKALDILAQKAARLALSSI